MKIVNILFPILLCISLGTIMGRFLRVEVRPLSQLVLYILSPCLTFSWLMKIKLTAGETFEIIIFTIIHFALSFLLMAVVLYLFPMSHSIKSSAILSSIFMNSANYGLPVVLFAFGEAGMERAIIFVVTQLVLFNTMGVYWGSQSSANRLLAMKRVLYLPTIYGVLLAAILRITEINIPEMVITATGMLGEAAIPVMLVLLGIQLESIKQLKHIRLVVGVTIFRLIISPALALFILSFIMKTENQILVNVLLLESAMPTAVNNMLLAIEFEGEPDVTSSSIILTTLLSFFTLSWLLSVLIE